MTELTNKITLMKSIEITLHNMELNTLSTSTDKQELVQVHQVQVLTSWKRIIYKY